MRSPPKLFRASARPTRHPGRAAEVLAPPGRPVGHLIDAESMRFQVWPDGRSAAYSSGPARDKPADLSAPGANEINSGKPLTTDH